VGEPILGQYCTPPPPPSPSVQNASCPPEREWIYWYGGQPHQECGCITVNADKDAAGKPIPWMGDKFAMVYFAGGRYQVDWTYRKDGLPIYQGPWYYAAKDGSVNGVPNGFTSNTTIAPINGYTYLADNQPWAAMKPKKVYVSGSKLGSTWKNCGVAESPGGTSPVGGGSPTVSPTEQLWVTQKAALDTLMTKLGQSAVALAKAQEAFRKETREKLDPYLDKLLQNSATPVPSIAPSTKIAEVSSAQAQLQYDFKMIVNILSTISKKQNDSAQSDSLNKTLLQASIYYLSAIFNVSYTPMVTAGSACYADPVEQQLVFQYGTKTLLKQDVWSPLSKLISVFHCMPIEQLNNFDRSFTAAFKYAVEMIGSTHPAYKATIQDQLLQIFSPVFINLYEVVRHEGAGVPVRSLITLLGDRMKTVPDKAASKTEAGITLDPTVFGLYNSETGKAEQVSTSCTGTLKEFWVNNCLIFRSFIHALNNPAMDDFGSCPFWMTLRLGKACLPSPPPKTSWLKKAALTTVAILENTFVSTAHADAFSNCEAKGMEEDLCGKCVPKSVGDPQGEAPKTKCEIACGYCSYPQGCVTTLFCPFDGSKKMYCQKPVYAADGKTVACPGGPCLEAPCSDMQKAYGNCPNLPLCQECSKCVHDNNANTCKGQVQDCLTLCSKNNNLNCTCGNWIIDADEECDDGNMKNGDGCSATCKKVSACGNGITNDGEECDDGNKQDLDKCDNNCKNGTGVCGDNVIDFDEKCDDGAKNSYPGSKCSALCQLLCGNGLLDKDAGEECDTGKNLGWDGCNKVCKKQAPVCGNGHIEKGETCDDGNTKSGDNCSSTCLLEKKYCDQCKYPNFKGKSVACDKYYAQLESGQKPGCTIASTPWDGSSCKLTPYKKGDPCWMQLPFSLPACRDDPTMGKCIADCKANEGDIPPDVKLDCDRGPIQPKIGSGFDTATLDEMKKIYNDNWNKAIQAFKLLAGDAAGGDLSDAKSYGWEKIVTARPFSKEELDVIAIDTKGAVVGAGYVLKSKEICYNQGYFKTISKTSVAKAVVHEAFHAAFDRMIGDAELKQLKTECGFPDLYVQYGGGVDHWVFNILSANELIKNPIEPTGFNDVMCPKNN
jgi:cysteine-rich repeat protein